MKRILIGLVLLIVGLMAFAEYQQGAACPRATSCVTLARANPIFAVAAEETPKENQTGAKQAIMANIKTFMEAFNRKDAKAILPLFAENCQLTEHDGTVVQGLQELDDQLKDTFAAEPTARISVSVESLRFLTDDVAIEEGKTTFYPDGKTVTAETEYEVTHVKKADRWQMASARSFNRTVLSPYDRLRDLEWLIGDWVDESTDSLVESSYRWDENKSFLLNDFTIRVKGRSVMKGTQRIGWDPLTKQIKAWVFDSEGGHAESLWSSVDDVWVIKSKGVRTDGKVVTVTNQLEQLTKDRMRFETLDRIVGEERMPPTVVFAVRRPPAAKR